jgi:hypothetical protein
VFDLVIRYLLADLLRKLSALPFSSHVAFRFEGTVFLQFHIAIRNLKGGATILKDVIALLLQLFVTFDGGNDGTFAHGRRFALILVDGPAFLLADVVVDSLAIRLLGTSEISHSREQMTEFTPNSQTRRTAVMRMVQAAK